MTDAVTLTVLGAPIGKGRPRFSARGGHMRAYTPAKTENYSNRLSGAAQDAMDGRLPLDGPVELTMRAVLGVPASWSKRKQADALTGALLPTVKPDADNLVKLVMDALNTIVWKDDKQVVRCVIDKRYGPQPCVVITAKPIEAAT